MTGGLRLAPLSGIPPITVICLALFFLFFGGGGGGWREEAQNVPDSSGLLPAQVLESAIIPRGPDSFLRT